MRRTRLRQIVPLTVALLVVTGCAAGGGNTSSLATPGLATPGSGAVPQPVTPSSPSDLSEARFVRVGSNTVVLTTTGLYRAADNRLQPLGPPFAPTSGQRVAVAGVDPAHLVAAATSGARTVDVRHSVDGGQTWASPRGVRIQTDNGIGRLSVAAIGALVVVLANEASSAAVSNAMIAASPDDGATWSVLSSPTGGTLSREGGVFWLVGGVMGDKVYESTDGANWRSITLPLPAAYWTAGSPAQVDGVGTVIPVTTHEQGASQMMFVASQDQGVSWSIIGSTPGPQTEFTTTLPTSITSGGDWMTVWPDGSKVLAGNVSQVDANKIISPNGLASNVYGVVLLSSAEAYALAAPSSCPDGKQSCTSTTVLLHTVDGGQTWSAVL